MELADMPAGELQRLLAPLVQAGKITITGDSSFRKIDPELSWDDVYAVMAEQSGRRVWTIARAGGQ